VGEERTGRHTHIAHEEIAGTGRKGLIIALSITSLMMVAEVIGGILTNSLALLSDAGHMLTDSLALALSLFALSFASRPASETKTYGFYRAEILAALVNAVILAGISVYIFYEAYRRFLDPPVVKSVPMLIVAGIGLAANLVGASFLARSGRESLNVKSALFHMLGDAVSSVGVIIAGLIILFARWYPADPLISVAIGLIIIWGAWQVVEESIHILLEGVPSHVDMNRLIAEIKSIKGVRDVHDAHLWTITSGMHAFAGHVLIDDILTSHSDEILTDLNHLLRDHYQVAHTTIQFECEFCEDVLVCRLQNHVRQVGKKE
jgi:cobalt-zinc-cadmium efflux system protein